jgi:hypothetical protein
MDEETSVNRVDRQHVVHRAGARDTYTRSLAVRCFSAMAALIVLVATADQAHALCFPDEVGGECVVNGEPGISACLAGHPVCFPINRNPPPPPPSPDVWTQHNNNSRTGAQLAETILKPSNVGPLTFGKLYERSVYGQIIAQPLYISNVAIPGKGLRNVVYVATRENIVYAFDVDDLDPDPSRNLWWTPVMADPSKSNLGVGDSPFPDMCPETIGPIGITSTPVIDRSTGTMYVVARHQVNDRGEIWLHALDIATAKVKGSVQINAGYGDYPFAQVQLSRAGLLLVNGAVIIGFSALNCDNKGWHGWVLAYRASDLQQVSSFATTSESGSGGGVWASGKGLVADTLGNIYFETGNGSVGVNADGNITGSGTGICKDKSGRPVTDFGQSFVKLTLGPPPTYTLTCAGYYTVNNWNALNFGQALTEIDGKTGSVYSDSDQGEKWHHGDTDLGSSGPILLPDNHLVGGGKQGKLYVLNSTLQSTQNQPVGPPGAVAGGSDGFQAFVNTWHDDDSQPECMTPDSVLGTRCYMPHRELAAIRPRYEEDEYSGPNIHSGVIYWNRRLYGMPEKDYLVAFDYDLTTGKVATSPSATSKVRAPDGMPGAAISLSANGFADGIIWASIPKYDGQTQNVPGQFVAFDAITLEELWRDDDNIGFAKFNPPTIADGKVFRPTFADKLIVYGPKSGPTPASCYTIAEVYENFSRENGLLGSEIGGGNNRNYAGGAIYWTPQTCGHEVHGLIIRWKKDGVADPMKGIYAEWKAVGLATGFLGYPITDETVTPDGIGRYNHFQNGSIYWSPTTGAHEVHGSIRAEWARRGWEQSGLGYPVSDEIDEPDGSGRVSLFEHGAIHWNGTTGRVTVQLDANILFGPQQAGTDRPGMDIAHFVPPQANPTMCEVSCAGNSACKAWTYVAPNTIQGPQPQCWLKGGGIPLQNANTCCTSGITVAVQPPNMTRMLGAYDRLGGDFKGFALPVSDPRLCQGECAENGTCKAWSYDVVRGLCFLKGTRPDAAPNKCCSSGAKN